MKKRNYFSLYLVFLIFLTLLLFAKPFIGIADNGDYSRVIQPFGFIMDNVPRFYYALEDFHLSTVNNQQAFLTSIKNIIALKLENQSDYSTTQSFFIKTAMLGNYFAKLVFHKDAAVFDIRFLGLTYIIFYSIGLYLFNQKSNFQKPQLKIVQLLLTLFMFCDVGYLVYFHSFYGEAAILVSFFLIVGFVSWMIHDEEEKKLPVLLFFISSIIFVGAKVANTPVGVLLALFSLLFLFVRKEKLSRVLIIGGAATILLFSVISYIQAPTWMKKLNNYNTIFYGVLKDSPSPEQDLRDMGINEKYNILDDTNGSTGFVDVYSDELTKGVYEKASYVDVLKFYVTHPKRFIEKLEVSADNSVFLRPSYLSNFEKKDSEESLLFTERFSLWENLRKKTVGFAFYIIVIYSFAYLAVLTHKLYLFIRSKNKDYQLLIKLAANLLLLCTAAGQFIIPIIGNGEADLQKHMFLFTICFDLMILIGLLWLLDRLVLKKLRNKYVYGCVAGVLVITLLLNLSFTKSDDTLSIGDTITMGQYKNKPLEWTVIDINDEKGVLLWLKDTIHVEAFDKSDESLAQNESNYGSNYWENSDLRRWLNKDFLSSFSENEKEMINETKLKHILPYHLLEQKMGGDRPFNWTSIVPYVDQNYNRAYFDYSYDKVFLLDVEQLKKYVYNHKISTVKTNRTSGDKEEYWLRTPYYYSKSMTRTVGKDGFVYHKHSNTADIGIAPAIYLNKNSPLLK